MFLSCSNCSIALDYPRLLPYAFEARIKKSKKKKKAHISSNQFAWRYGGRPLILVGFEPFSLKLGINLRILSENGYRLVVKS